MTREEREKAIDLLDNLRGMIEDNQGNDYDYALKKGIEALEQEHNIDKIIDTIDWEEKWLLEAGYNYSNVNIAFRSIKHDLRKVEKKMTREELIDYIYPVNTVYIGITHPGYGLWVEIDKFTWKRIK